MDVGLDVKLRFGTGRMLLREVLALSAGVVVELDNALHSPVELLLDGRLIAKGEVVIVDGKYGLRVTEVPEGTLAAGPGLIVVEGEALNERSVEVSGSLDALDHAARS